MNPLSIIQDYYKPQSDAFRILVNHGQSVAEKALAIAKAHPEMRLDLAFVEEAAMLHDIGIVLCNAPEIDCHGTFRYVCHGYLGADILRQEGYPRHALVSERHTGTGIPLSMIKERNLPLPHRDFMPIALEEQLICFADKFFSKTKLNREKSVEEIQKSLSKYGENTVNRFNEWCKVFL